MNKQITGNGGYDLTVKLIKYLVELSRSDKEKIEYLKQIGEGKYIEEIEF